MRENLIDVYFDGGCQPNPGERYGSWELVMGAYPIKRKLYESYGYGTNNEAEFLALESGLRYLVERIKEEGYPVRHWPLQIWSDSEIVVYRLSKGSKRFGKINEGMERMTMHADRCMKLLVLFKAYRIAWNTRQNNVSRFGH